MPPTHAPLTPDRFENMLVALGIGATVMSAVWAWRGNEEAMGMALVLTLLCSALWILSRRGMAGIAASVIVVALNVVTIAGVSYFGGPRAHAPAFLMVVVMCSGLMVGWRGGALSLGVCTAYVLVDGWYGPPPWATGKIAQTPSQITVDWALALVLAGSLAVVAFHTASQRIEEAMRSEADRKLALQQAEAASRAKSEFLANMSHELRTPLTAIMGYSELLSDELDAQHAQDARRIGEAGNHLLDLINEVLDMSRVESGRVDLELLSVDLEAVLHEVVSVLAPVAADQNCTVKTDFSGLGSGLGDRLRIRQIVQNLLSNAIKYAPGPIEVEGSRDGDTMVIAVRDHGSGIPAAVADTVFEPFSRGHSHEVQGTGLGLALASSLAVRMGGTLTVDSTADGATFTLTLPVG